MAKLYCVVFLAIAVVISTVSAITEEEKNAIKLDVIPILTKCGEKLGVTKDQVKAAKEANDADAIDPCFYACFMKEKNIINEEGAYDPEVAKSLHAKFIHDEELVGKLDEISDTCKSVNDEVVSDGAEGCQRAKLLVHCLSEHKDVITSIFKE